MWKAIALILSLAIVAIGFDKVLAQPFNLQVNPNVSEAYREPTNLELMNAVRELSAHAERLGLLLVQQQAELNSMKETLDTNNEFVRDIQGRLALVCNQVMALRDRPSSYCVASAWRLDFTEMPFY